MCRVRASLLLIASLSVFPGWARSSPAEQRQATHGVGCIGLTVSDADRASDFYTRVLDFRRELETEVAGETWEHWPEHSAALERAIARTA